MAVETGKIYYHDGFYAAVMAEYERDHAGEMEYLQEHKLGEQPLRIDLVIIRHLTEALGDPIGSFFRKYNVTEYKSPEDGLTMDDFDKTHAYAYVFKSLSSASDKVLFEDLTVSIFRHAYPRALMSDLQTRGFDVMRSFPGVYHVTSRTTIPTQVVVISELAEGTYPGMKLLNRNARREDVDAFLKSIVDTEQMNEYAKGVLQVSIAANPELFDAIKKEDSVMNAAVERLFASEFAASRNEGKKEGIEEGKKEGKKEGIENVAVEMLKGNMDEEQIARFTQLTMGRIKELKKKLAASAAVL